MYPHDSVRTLPDLAFENSPKSASKAVREFKARGVNPAECSRLRISISVKRCKMDEVGLFPERMIPVASNYLFQIPYEMIVEKKIFLWKCSSMSFQGEIRGRWLLLIRSWRSGIEGQRITVTRVSRLFKLNVDRMTPTHSGITKDSRFAPSSTRRLRFRESRVAPESGKQGVLLNSEVRLL